MPDPVLSARSRFIATRRHHGPDHPDTVEAQRDLAAEKLAVYVARIVDEAPPLSGAQLERIAALLRPAIQHEGARTA